MTGQQLLQELQSLDPEDLKKEVVVEGEDGWLYAASNVELIAEHEGREVDEPDAPVDCIAIKSTW